MGSPAFFTFPLLADALLSRTVTVRPVDAEGFPGAPAERTFSGADPEAWAAELFRAVDAFLSPALADAVPAGDPAQAALAAVRVARHDLADALARTLVPVLDGTAGPAPDVTALVVARELRRSLGLAAATTVVSGGEHVRLVTVADPAAATTAAADVAGLGAVTVPVPLRALPAPPLVSGQSADATYAAPAGLGEAGRWSYAVTFSAELAAQDDVAVTLLLDGPPPVAASGGDVPGVIEALAAYAVDAAAIDTLLRGFTDPSSDVPVRRSRNAAATFAAHAAAVAAAWPAAPPEPPAPPAPDPYTVSLRAGRDGLTVTAGAAGPGPDGTWPEVTYADAVLVRGEPAGGRCPYAFPAGVTPVRTPAVTLTWPGLDVVTYERARASVAVTRNAALLTDGPATTAGLVVRSRRVAAEGDVVPSLRWTQPYDLSPYGATPAEALPAALAALLGDATGVPLRIGVSYESDGALVPVLDASVEYADDTGRALADQMAAWLTRDEPVAPGAAWHVAVTVSARAGGDAAPLLRLADLVLPA
jgi:hypothetical protein